MTAFHYRGMDAKGEMQVGTLDAENLAMASDELHSRGLVPIELSSSGKTLAMRLNEPVHLFGKPTERDVQGLLRDISRLLAAGLSIDETLKLMINREKKELFRTVLEDVLDRVRRGESLSAAFSQHGQCFSVQVVASVHAGELSGTLAASLDTMSIAMDRSLSFQERLRGALIYPAILMVGVCATFVLVVTFVLPQFAPLFNGHLDKLPLATRFVLWLTNLFEAYGAWLMFISFLSVAGIFVAWGNNSFRARVLQRVCQLPGLGKWFQMPDVIRFFRTVGVCSQSGMALDNAIAMAVDAVKMPHLGASFSQARVAVRRGDLLSTSLEKFEWIPALSLQFARVGEQSGKLGTMLEEAASILAQEYEGQLEKALEVLSPVLTLVMGAIVALLVGSVLLGIMSINDVVL